MTANSTFNARNASVYERSMGRWSRLLAAQFVDFAGLAPGERVLDCGCGTGSLLRALAARPEQPEITGIDASPIYVAAAQQVPGVARVEAGDACALPYPDASFDRVLTQLVLQFIPDAARAAAEMVRVTRPGGTVAAAVWASGGGMVAQRMFLDTAALIDPAAATLRDHTFTRPMTRHGELVAVFHSLGLADVTESSATIWMSFADFADWWSPYADGEGTLGKYVAALPERERTRLEAALRSAYLCGEPDGRRSFAATALLCRGRRPG
jgi:ubiquinone/menaquinone biosynthesis C-methylase UbiE